MALIAMTATAAFRSVGVMLALTLFVAPPLLARQLTNRWPMILLAILLSGVTCFIGVALSRHFLSQCGIALSTSALIATLLSPRNRRSDHCKKFTCYSSTSRVRPHSYRTSLKSYGDSGEDEARKIESFKTKGMVTTISEE